MSILYFIGETKENGEYYVPFSLDCLLKDKKDKKDKKTWKNIQEEIYNQLKTNHSYLYRCLYTAGIHWTFEQLPFSNIDDLVLYNHTEPLDHDFTFLNTTTLPSLFLISWQAKIQLDHCGQHFYFSIPLFSLSSFSLSSLSLPYLSLPYLSLSSQIHWKTKIIHNIISIALDYKIKKQFYQSSSLKNNPLYSGQLYGDADLEKRESGGLRCYNILSSLLLPCPLDSLHYLSPSPFFNHIREKWLGLIPVIFIEENKRDQIKTHQEILYVNSSLNLLELVQEYEKRINQALPPLSTLILKEELISLGLQDLLLNNDIKNIKDKHIKDKSIKEWNIHQSPLIYIHRPNIILYIEEMTSPVNKPYTRKGQEVGNEKKENEKKENKEIKEKVEIEIEANSSLEVIKKNLILKGELVGKEDRFFYAGKLCPDSIPLFSLGISESFTTLQWIRENSHLTFEYICSECFSTIVLKPDDIICCPYCNSRIVHKPRTKEACMYKAR